MTNALDWKKTDRWAIATVSSVGAMGSGILIFDLVNLRTGRAHNLRLTGGGFSLSPVVDIGVSVKSYTAFRTGWEVNFDDFDGAGASFTNLSAVLYSVGALTIWKDSAYFSRELAQIEFSGWGLSTPEFPVCPQHGVLTVEYGDGEPLTSIAPVALYLDSRDINLEIPECMRSCTRVPKEDPIRTPATFAR